LGKENADAVEHQLDVFAQSGAEEEEEDGNSYVIPCFFRKSRICWISCGVYGRVRVSLGYCQMLISQIGLSGGPSDHRLNTAWHHINSICMVVNSCCFLAPGDRKQNNRLPASGGGQLFTMKIFVIPALAEISSLNPLVSRKAPWRLLRSVAVSAVGGQLLMLIYTSPSSGESQ
jgi:hypothetical protein